MAVTAMKVKFI